MSAAPDKLHFGSFDGDPECLLEIGEGPITMIWTRSPGRPFLPRALRIVTESPDLFVLDVKIGYWSFFPRPDPEPEPKPAHHFAPGQPSPLVPFDQIMRPNVMCLVDLHNRGPRCLFRMWLEGRQL